MFVPAGLFLLQVSSDDGLVSGGPPGTGWDLPFFQSDPPLELIQRYTELSQSYCLMLEALDLL